MTFQFAPHPNPYKPLILMEQETTKIFAKAFDYREDACKMIWHLMRDRRFLLRADELLANERSKKEEFAQTWKEANRLLEIESIELLVKMFNDKSKTAPREVRTNTKLGPEHITLFETL